MIGFPSVTIHTPRKGKREDPNAVKIFYWANPISYPVQAEVKIQIISPRNKNINRNRKHRERKWRDIIQGLRDTY